MFINLDLSDLCFGIKASPVIFQETMDVMLAGMDGVISYLDDVIVVGKIATMSCSWSTHSRNYRRLC